MVKKKDEPIDLNHIKPEDQLKYEIAEELGLIDKVVTNGWRSLSAKESGRIGGIMTRRRRDEKKRAEEAKQQEETQKSL